MSLWDPKQSTFSLKKKMNRWKVYLPYQVSLSTSTLISYATRDTVMLCATSSLRFFSFSSYFQIIKKKWMIDAVMCHKITTFDSFYYIKKEEMKRKKKKLLSLTSFVMQRKMYVKVNVIKNAAYQHSWRWMSEWMKRKKKMWNENDRAEWHGANGERLLCQ